MAKTPCLSSFKSRPRSLRLQLANTSTDLDTGRLGLGLSEAAYRRALEVAGLAPSRSDWLRNINRFLIAVGTLLIVAGITAFFAWNWADLSYMKKFVLIQSGIVATAVLAWRLGIDSIGGRASLFSSAFLVGVLLAVLSIVSLSLGG